MSQDPSNTDATTKPAPNSGPEADEPLPTYTAAGEWAGLVQRATVHKSGLWHKAVNVFVFRSDGRLILQRRSGTKDVCPNLLDLSTAEHLQLGESYLAAALRGLNEELGIATIDLAPIGEVVDSELKLPESDVHDCEWQQCFVGISDAELRINPKEVAKTSLWDPTELAEAIAAEPELFTPWLQRSLEHTQLLKRAHNFRTS